MAVRGAHPSAVWAIRRSKKKSKVPGGAYRAGHNYICHNYIPGGAYRAAITIYAITIYPAGPTARVRQARLAGDADTGPMIRAANST